MDSKDIETKIPQLPFSELGKEAEDHEIWEETDGGAHFKVTKHVLPIVKGFGFIAMTVSGIPEERARVVQEFTDILGKPDDLGVVPEIPNPVVTVGWVIKLTK